MHSAKRESSVRFTSSHQAQRDNKLKRAAKATLESLDQRILFAVPSAAIFGSINDVSMNSASLQIIVDYSEIDAGQKIKLDSIDASDLEVRKGGDIIAGTLTREFVNQVADAANIRAIYSFVPDGGWAGAGDGAYSVYVKASQVSNDQGTPEYVAAGQIAGSNFTVEVDTIAPVAAYTAGDLTTAGASFDFTIQYTDAKGVKVSSIGAQNLLVTGPNGYSQNATLVSVDQPTNGSPRTATYRITGLSGAAWRSAMNGEYIIRYGASPATDVNNNPVGAEGDELDRFDVAIVDATAPAIHAFTRSHVSQSSAGASYTFTITFRDLESQVLRSSLTGSQVQILAPDTSVFATADFVSASPDATADTIVATYTATTNWAGATSGNYTLRLIGGAVSNNDSTGVNTVDQTDVATFNVDVTKPTAVIGAISDIDASNPASITFTVTYADDVAGLTVPSAGHELTITKSGGGTLTAIATGEAGGVVTYELTRPGGGWAHGTYTVTVPAGTVQDARGNGNLQQTRSFAVDAAVPAVSETTLPDIGSSNPATFEFTLTFSDNVGITPGTAPEVGDTLAITGADNLTATVISVTGNANAYVVTYEVVRPGGGWVTGSYTITVPSSTVSDAIGNDNALSTFTFVADTVAPTAVIGAISDIDAANPASITFTVTYNDDVNYLEDLSNDTLVVSLSGGGTLMASATGVAGGVVTYTLTRPGGGWAAGTYTVTVPAGKVSDAAGNENAQVTATFDVDAVKPTATITSAPNVTVANPATYSFTVRYSDNVGVATTFTVGVSTLDITTPAAATITATASAVDASDPENVLVTYTVNRPGGGWETGTHTITIPGATASDAIGNDNVLVTGTFVSDLARPTAVIGAIADITAANPASITFDVTYNDDVAYLEDLSNDTLTISLSGGGTLTASATGVAGGVVTYTLTRPGGGWAAGTYTVTVPAGKVSDAAGNQNLQQTATFDVDAAKPTATVTSAPDIDLANPATYSFTVRYSDNVGIATTFTVGVSTLDITTPAAATITATASAVDASDPENVLVTYTVNRPGGGWETGTHTITIPVATASDAIGNDNVQVTDTFAIDTVRPTAVIGAIADITAANPASITFTVTYNDNVGILEDLSNDTLVVSLSGGGTLTANATGVAGGVVTYTLTRPGGGWAAGTYTVTVPAGKVSDALGNQNLQQTATFDVDVVKPTATVTSAPDIDLANPATYSFTVRYSDNVGVATAFTVGVSTLDITTPAAATITATASAVDASDPENVLVTYTVNRPGGGWETGTHTITIPVNTAQDAVGNQNILVTDTFVADVAAPVAAIGALADIDYTNPASISFDVTYTDVGGITTDLNNHTLTISMSGGGTLTAEFDAISGNANSYTVTYTLTRPGGGWALGTYTVTVPAGAVVDGVGNASAQQTATFGVDTGLPSATIGGLTNVTAADEASVTFTVTFDDANALVSVPGMGDLLTLNRAGGGSVTAEVTNVAVGAGNARTVTYTIAKPGGGWVGGVYTITIAAGEVTDGVGNANLEATATIRIDTDLPTATIAGAADINIATAAPYSFTVTFDDATSALSGLPSVGSTLTLNRAGGGTLTATVTGIADGAGNAKIVTYAVAGGWVSGTYTITTGTVTDAVGNSSVAATDTFVVDLVRPTVAIGGLTNVTAANEASVTFTVTFDGNSALASVPTLGELLTLNRTGGGSVQAEVTNVAAGAGNAWIVTYTIARPGGGWVSGVYTISVAADEVANAAGNGNLGATQTILVDTNLPTAEVVASELNIATGATYTFSVVFNDATSALSGLPAVNDTLTLNRAGGGTLTATVSAVESGAGFARIIRYTVARPGGGWVAGTYTITSTTVTDAAGNSSVAATGTFVVDVTRPTVSIVAGNITAASSDTVSFTVTFDDANVLSSVPIVGNTLTLARTGGGSLLATVTGVADGAGNAKVVTYSITRPGGGWVGGTYTITVAADEVMDAVGNGNLQATQTFQVDAVAPTAAISAATINLATVAPYNFTIAYTDVNALSGLPALGSTLTLVHNSGDPANDLTATVVSIADLAGGVKLLTCRIVSADWVHGQYTITAPTVTDAVGNASEAATQTVVADLVRPTAVISAGDINVSTGATATFTITFTDAGGLASLPEVGDELVVSSGEETLTATVTGVAGGVVTYTMNRPGPRWDDGVFTITLPVNAALDNAGNGTPGTTATFTIDNSRPTSGLTYSDVAIAYADEWTFVVTFHDAAGIATDLTEVDDSSIVTLVNEGGNVAIERVSYEHTGTGITLVYRIAGAWTNGWHTITIAEGVVTDANGNTSTALSPATFNADMTRPTVSIEAGDIDAENPEYYSFVVIYSDTEGDAYSLQAPITISGPGDITLTAEYSHNAFGMPGAAVYVVQRPEGGWAAGHYTIGVDAGTGVDSAGNENSIGATAEFHVDVQKPAFVVNATTIAMATGNTQTFSLVFSDNAAIVEGPEVGDILDVTTPQGGTTQAVVTAVEGLGTNTVTITLSLESGGAWQSGGYVVSVPEGFVADEMDNVSEAGTAVVSSDQVRPWVSEGRDMTVDTATEEPITFDFTYSDDNALVMPEDLSDLVALTVYRGAGLSQVAFIATPVSFTVVDSRTLRVSYRIEAPAGGWSSVDNGEYFVRVADSDLSDDAGNVNISRVSRLMIEIADTWAPVAEVSAEGITSAGTAGHLIQVTYTDNLGMDWSTISTGDVMVSGPNSYMRNAVLLGYRLLNGGATAVATYQVDAPEGGWRLGTNGTYTITVAADAVSDHDGNTMVDAATGEFTVNVPVGRLDDSGTLVIEGSEDADIITVDLSGANVVVTVNGVTGQFTAADVDHVTVYARGGNDRVTMGRTLGIDAYLDGGSGNDSLYGSDSDDVLVGGSGDDSLSGYNGQDWIRGGRGNDNLNGGRGNDILRGNVGSDTLNGGTGDDVLDGGAGRNTMLGSAGNDLFFASNGIRDSIDGGTGTDSLLKDSVDLLTSVETILTAVPAASR